MNHITPNNSDFPRFFIIGPGDPAAGFPPRVFPERCPGFEAAWTAYYEEVNRLAQRLLSAFALALNQSEDFFLQFTDHHASVRILTQL
jgi:isopenicillin N synthase-like dioxygenase